MKGNVSSFLSRLSFEYRKATDFYLLILCLATLLKACISYRNVLRESLGSLMNNIITSAETCSFDFSLSYLNPPDPLQLPYFIPQASPRFLT